MNEKKEITQEIRDKLREPMPAEAISAHPTKSFLTTIKSIYIVERLNDIFGVGKWNIEHEIVLHNDNYVLMKGELKILEYNCNIPVQYGGHNTIGKNVEMADGFKSAVTDILSKCASYLEIGIDVFKGKANQSNKPWLKPNTIVWEKAIEYLDGGGTIDKILKKYNISSKNKELLTKI